MKKSSSLEDIESPINVTIEDIQEAERIQDSPEKMLALIDLIFLFSDRERHLS